ncbi:MULTISPECIES: hypothetical protein [unclassified Acinetobacter]|uniref:hypothetical protein n=1 Tax=unclassified Acinetobacter TaxID=196816 RepID=UPI0020909D60|nr:MULTISPECIES: hypothetical protein [unclassified Acinetobacter]
MEQAIGNLIAFYHNAKVEEKDWIEPIDACPHEDEVETSFEAEAMKRRQKQQAM